MDVRTGTGKMHFVLGHGPSGVAGHVELLLQTVPNSGQISIQWQVENNRHAGDARDRVEKYASEWLRGHLAGHPGYGFLVTIMDVTSDAERQNDYERAVAWALYDAVTEMGLPVPQIFSDDE